MSRETTVGGQLTLHNGASITTSAGITVGDGIHGAGIIVDNGSSLAVGGVLADDLGGQPEGRTLHQGTIGQAGEQRRFGVTDCVY